MSHHRHSVERRLSVENHNVPVYEVPLDNESRSKCVCVDLKISDIVQSDLDAVRPDNIIRSWMLEGPVEDQLLQKLLVPWRYFLRNRKLPRNFVRYADFGNVEGRIGRYYCP